MELAKFDELDSLIKGILYIEQANPNECYYWSNPAQPEESVKTLYDFSKPYPFLVRAKFNFLLLYKRENGGIG